VRAQLVDLGGKGTTPAHCERSSPTGISLIRQSRRQVNFSEIMRLLAAESREYCAYSGSCGKVPVFQKFSSFKAIEIPRFRPHLSKIAFRRGLGLGRCAGEPPSGTSRNWNGVRSDEGGGSELFLLRKFYE
jgi:hypothetical protein